MKNTNKNNQNQIQPSLFGFWINNNIHNQIIIKKKFISNNNIKNKNKDDEDSILKRCIWVIRLVYWFI